VPTVSEKVTNQPLSGTELKEILRQDFDKLLASDGMLADRVAYGRCAYHIRLTLHTGNVYWPESTVDCVSDRRGVIDDEHVVPEKMPLSPAPPDEHFAAHDLSRKIDSPNMERLRTGMPVPIQRKQADGTIITEHVKYPADALEQSEPDRVSINDTTTKAREEWHL
jgi:hypothetical protein